MKTQADIRQSFWDAHPRLQKFFRKAKRQNSYCADIRMAFIDHVDYLQKSGVITEKLAGRVTL